MTRIRGLRLERNMTMRQVAEKLEIPYTTYVNYEKGLREPNSEMLIKIANFYGVTIDYLLGNVNDPSFYVDNARTLADINSYEDTEKVPTETGEHSISDAELKFALWGDYEDVDDDDLADVRRYAAFVRERKKDRK